jgi:peptide deformylase
VTVLAIREIGDPVLRERSHKVSAEELATPETQQLIDDMIETMREAGGAGIAANQVGEVVRIAVAEVSGQNPRYPYKPELPLTVFVNPVIEPIGEIAGLINEGCLSVPGVRAEVPRRLEVRVRYVDRDGTERVEEKRGLTAGTFQHEVDHLDGILIVDRADSRSLSSWESYERFHREDFERRALEIVERFGQ